MSGVEATIRRLPANGGHWTSQTHRQEAVIPDVR
jgi:hypothetical protein